MILRKVLNLNHRNKENNSHIHGDPFTEHEEEEEYLSLLLQEVDLEPSEVTQKLEDIDQELHMGADTDTAGDLGLEGKIPQG